MEYHIKVNSPLIFAPMEGVTDHHFRKMILTEYPSWDYIYTDFLRLSTNQNYKPSFILKFFGIDQYDLTDKYCQKVILQILSTPKSTSAYNILQIADLGFQWIDLNLGCPSKQVVSHKGGSYLLSNLKELEHILTTIRKNFQGYFSVKMRTGYKNSENFKDLLHLIEDCGVDLITLHARTQTELYRGKANWEMIKQASKQSNIPIIGNGDIQTLEQLRQFNTPATCQGVMVGRGAIRRPWLAQQWYDNKKFSLAQENTLRVAFMHKILETYDFLDSTARLKKMKKLTHYLFDSHESIKKSQLLRSNTLREFMQEAEIVKPQFKD